MASVKSLFERHSSLGGITNETAWLNFSHDLESFGLGSQGLSNLLKRVGGVLSIGNNNKAINDSSSSSSSSSSLGEKKSVEYADILIAAANSGGSGSNEAIKIVQDLRQDAAALKRFVDYVRDGFQQDAPERAALESGLEDVAEAYRAGLLHLLRLSTIEAEAIDRRQREKLLAGPIEHVLRNEAGEFASLDAKSLMPDPFDFQRVHCRSINIRLASVYVRSKQVAKHQRLYRLDRPGAVIASDKTTRDPDEESLATEKQITNALKLEKTGGGQTVEVFLGTRVGQNAEICASSAIPFELELIRAPALGVLDIVATASTTLGSFQAAAAITPSLYQPLDDPLSWLRKPSAKPLSAMVLQARATTAAHFSDFSMEEGEFASHMSSGGCPVPAPSSIPSVARAHPGSAMNLYSDYTAHTELILSPYFADTCGLHEAEDGALNLVCGPASLFCYEYVPGMVPLSQIISVCGRLPEGRKIFRYIAAELVRALADIEAQCTFNIAPGSITCENIYLSEKGSKLLLRGVAWGDPILPNQDDTEAMLQQRSKVLLKTFGEILNDLLVDSSTKGTDNQKNDTDEESEKNIDKDTVSIEQEEEVYFFHRDSAELGIHVSTGATIEIVLPHEASELFQAPSNDIIELSKFEKSVWLAPMLKLTSSGDSSGVSIQSRTEEMIVQGNTSKQQNGRNINSKRSRIVLKATKETAQVLTFYLVSASSESASQRRPRTGQKSIGGGRGNQQETKPGDINDNGFLICPPSTSDIIATATVPIFVYPRRLTPTLSVIIDACNPSPEESAAVASLRLLAVLVAKSTGMVNGKKLNQLKRITDTNNSASNSNSNLDEPRDPIKDDETFLAVIRQVAAMLRLNKAASEDPSQGDNQSNNHGAITGAMTTTTKTTTTSVGNNTSAKKGAAAASASASAEVSDVDAFAALLAAMEMSPTMSGEQGRGGGGEGRGGSAADADAELARHERHDRKTIRWVSHLARHPYFAVGIGTDKEIVMELQDVMTEYTSWAWPLEHMR
jgi:hypothetical protein